MPDEHSLFSKAIINEWGSYSNFINEFTEKGSSIEASGWCWLAIDPSTKAMSIEITVDQDHVEQMNKVALLAIDAWEHAWALDYQHDKQKYLDNVWRIINWSVVNDRIQGA